MVEPNSIRDELIVVNDPLVEDDAENDETQLPLRYDITGYGIDFDVEGIIRRMSRGEIFIPPFQRSFIWTLRESSRFIESLLLGLPVPGIFLAKETDTGKLLVIDGQQRLRTLQYFYDGVFNPTPGDNVLTVFKLTYVQPEFAGLTYETLQSKDRNNLDNSVIHATVITQDAPPDDDTSLYQIFERLNSGGRRLYPQEMRGALYHGGLIDTIKELNEYPQWRDIFGAKSRRLKDQELILRFFAMYFDWESYQRPMSEFLNRFASKHRNPDAAYLNEISDMFTGTIRAFEGALGREAFKPVRALNAAVFDSMAVGLAKRIRDSDTPGSRQIKSAYESILNDSDYFEAITQSTSLPSSVETRMQKASQGFAE